MNTSHTFFKQNYHYHPRILYKKDIDPRFQLKSIEKLVTKLRNLMTTY